MKQHNQVYRINFQKLFFETCCLTIIIIGYVSGVLLHVFRWSAMPRKKCKLVVSNLFMSPIVNKFRGHCPSVLLKTFKLGF